MSLHAGENCSDSQPSSVNIVKLDTAAHEALLTSQAGLKLTLTDQVGLLLHISMLALTAGSVAGLGSVYESLASNVTKHVWAGM